MHPRAFAELEFPRILELAAALAGSEPGREVVLRAAPTPFPGEARERLDATAEMDAFLDREGRLDVTGLDPVDDILAELAIAGTILTPLDFRRIFGVVACAIRLRRRLLSLAPPEEGAPDPWPILRERGRLLPELSELDRMRARLFDAEGNLRDDASPELTRIRRAIHSRRDEIHRKAMSILRGDATVFQDSTIVQRGGRYCLPVRAEMKGRVAGILHERSQTGATVFIEPLAIVDMNNDLSALREEENEEIRRILATATASLAARREDLAAALELGAGLDALQARALFGRQTDAVRPVVEPGAPIHLTAVRHPLLDERLAPLRRRVFGEAEARERRHVVPVDVRFDPGTRVLVLTGPNAGGKTATLKAVGLASLLAQSGFFVPAHEARLPVFDRFETHLGDAQDLLSDLSSFSSYMTRLAEFLPEVGPGSLVLLDELGSATDPEEGGALAAAALERIAAAGGTAVVTTHLGFLKTHAAQNTGFAVAAMDYDASSGRPTYRVLPGVAGRSLALPIAERAGVPGTILERARALLGEGWVARERAESDLERARAELEKEKMAAAAARREREEERERLEREREAAAEAARKDRVAFRREMDRLRRVVDESLTRALGELRSKLTELAKGSPKALDREVERMRVRVLEEARGASSQVPDAPAAASGPLRPGDQVRLEGLGTVGVLRALDGAKGEKAVIEVSGKRMQVAANLLVRVGGSEAPAPAPARHAAYSGTRGSEAVPAEINLLGKTVDEAADLLDDYIDRALLSGRQEVRVIHGYGTGKLKAGVAEYLRKHPAVVSTRPGDDHEGGGGATIVRLDA